MGSFLIVNLQMRRPLKAYVTAKQPGLRSSVKPPCDFEALARIPEYQVCRGPQKTL